MRLNPPSPGFASGAVFLSASVWGLYWLPIRYLEDLGVSGAWAVALVNAPALLVLVPVMAWTWRYQRPHLARAALIGFFAGSGLALYALGLVHSTVVRATLLFYLTPVWATLIGIFWLGERAGLRRWGAMAGGFAGLALLVSGGGGAVPLNIGDFYALLSGMGWAIGAALIMRSGGVPLAGMTAFQFAFTAGAALLMGGLVGGFAVPAPDLLLASLPLAAAVAVLALLPAVLIIFWAQKFLYPGRVGLLMMSEVLVAVLSASLLLPDERLGPVEWAGAALIVAACFVEVWPEKKAAAGRV